MLRGSTRCKEGGTRVRVEKNVKTVPSKALIDEARILRLGLSYPRTF